MQFGPLRYRRGSVSALSAAYRTATVRERGDDPWIAQVGRAAVDNIEKGVPNLWKKVLLPGVGHSIEQEAPVEVNRLLIEFLHHLDSK